MPQLPWPLPSSASNFRSGSRQHAPERIESANSSGQPEAEAVPIIAICHLSWDWVWQRPQQFLSRFAQRHRVLFVETHCSDVPATSLEVRSVEEHPNVTVLRMHLPAARWADGAFIDLERRCALQGLLAGELHGQFEHPLLWFNDPMAVVAFAGQLGERAIVYDCMDELSQFKGAPPALLERERELLGVADVVFCGGQKMRVKRLPLNANCHFFGTGVDVTHFGAALKRELKIPPEIAEFGPAPILGYFGVIDERIDYELLAKLADARSDWHIVMVGPTAKVDPADFPQRANLHFIGARPYAQLPAFAKGFSVALMPFALNAATEFINPTKALEYMAAGRPVVSTALDEVRMNFGSVARLAESHTEFIAACAKEAESPSRARIVRGLKLAKENTWEALIARMEKHVADALAQNGGSGFAPQPETSAEQSRPKAAPTTRLAYV